MAGSSISLVIGMRRQFDLAAVCALVEQTPGLTVLAGDTNLARVINATKTPSPKALLLDPTFPKSRAIPAAHYLLINGAVQAAVILDHSFVIARAMHALEFSTCKYVTRDQSVKQIHEIIADVLRANPGNKHPNTTAKLRASDLAIVLAGHDPFGILKLSEREREVMLHLACGHSTLATARALKLARSTVENHKSRIMKRLDVHSAGDLVRIAIATGFIEFDDAGSGNGQDPSSPGPPRPHIVLAQSLFAG